MSYARQIRFDRKISFMPLIERQLLKIVGSQSEGMAF